MKAYEITAAFFYGGTDETDDRVIWVLADDQIMRDFMASHDAGQKLWGEVGGIRTGDEASFRAEGGQFVLPRDDQALRRLLNVFEQNPPTFMPSTLAEIIGWANGGNRGPSDR